MRVYFLYCSGIVFVFFCCQSLCFTYHLYHLLPYALTLFPSCIPYVMQGACGAPRAAGGRLIATVAHPVDRPSHIPTVSLPSFRPSPPWASTWAILVVYAPRYREVITAMPTKAHRGAAMMRHVADIKSTHSSNNCEHHRRPLDVIMTTQPSSRRRLAEAQGQW